MTSAYREELVFEHVGEPYLLYRQESWDLADGAPVHFERGFLRPGEAAGSLELCLAHPLGLTEVAHGAVRGTTLEFTATAIGDRSHGHRHGRHRADAPVPGRGRHARPTNSTWRPVRRR